MSKTLSVIGGVALVTAKVAIIATIYVGVAIGLLFAAMIGGAVAASRG